MWMSLNVLSIQMSHLELQKKNRVCISNIIMYTKWKLFCLVYPKLVVSKNLHSGFNKISEFTV